MTATVGDLESYLGTPPGEPTLPDLLEVAVDLVEGYLGTAGLALCPATVHDHAVIQLASELYARRNSPAGVAQWGPDGQAIRLARDAMLSVKPLLAPYRGLGVPG